MCGSKSTKLLNTDPIRIRIHNNVFKNIFLSCTVKIITYIAQFFYFLRIL